MDPPGLLLAALALCQLLLLSDVQATQCWRKPYCTCSFGERLDIYCSKVLNFSNVEGLLRKYGPAHSIRLRGPFDSLPSKAFEGVSVSILRLDAPLTQNISEDALLGIRDLRTLVLNCTRFESIPEALIADRGRYYSSFQSVRGGLTGLQNELQNLTSATEVVLSRNRISSIQPDAFLGTNKVEKLDLSWNLIANLDPELFDPMRFLATIDLSHNQLLTMDDCFNSLNPKNINLYGNNLTSVDNVFHQGMWNLRHLNLGGNPEIQLSRSTFNVTLKSLVELHMSNCDLGELQPSLLRNLWDLHYVYLNGNNLSTVPDYFLEHTPFVTTLELSNNRLKTVGRFLETMKERYNSMKLTLDGNELTTVALGQSRITVYDFDISRNWIQGIRAEDTSRLTGAARLNLSRNVISFLEEECFKGFLSLEVLDLSYNHDLTSLNRTLQGLPKLRRLDISSCSLESLTAEEFQGVPRLMTINVRNNSLSSVHGTFRNMKYIGTLDLASNNLTTLTADSFPPFQKISIRVRTLWMADNPWSCDCRLAWFANWSRRQGSKLRDEPVCASPANLQGVMLRSLNLTDFEKWTEDCPERCDCTCKSEGLLMYTEVRCLGKGLKEVPRVLPSNTRSLDMRGNFIESLDGRDILRLEQLERLNLENNKIQKVHLVFPPTLQSLRLAHNSLRSFPLDEWDNSNISVTLSYNPWTCNCHTWAFRNWLIQHNGTALDVEEIRCGSEEGFSLRNKPIISLTRKDLCSYLAGIIIIAGCCILLLIVCLVCLCCRQSIAAYLYHSCGCYYLKKSESHDYPYDAFLLYSEENESLALGELAKGLENGRQPFRLCIPTRDIPSPRTSEKVNAYIPQCTKVVVLFTREFMESQECLRHLISAMSFSTENSSQCVIFVTHGDLPSSAELDPALRTLLRSCTRLKWGQSLFWQKLIYQLPKKQRKNQVYGEPEDEPLMN